jgi:hypothetical protein
MPKHKDLTGQKFGEWEALYRDTKTDKYNCIYYLCKCSCGTIKSLSVSYLKRATRCIRCDRFIENKFFNDLSGKKFGHLLVLERDFNKSKPGKVFYNCKCDCGNIVSVIAYQLRSGKTKTCGCKNRLALIGQKIGKWTVLDFIEIRNKKAYFSCRCECGNIREVVGALLRAGMTKCCANCKQYGKKREKTYTELEIDRCRNKDHLFQQWAYHVKIRDKWRCIICKSKKIVQAHHLFAWAEYKELRYVLDNGVSLCRMCHEKFHSRYGKGRNTFIEFLEFAKNNNISDLNFLFKQFINIGNSWLTILKKMLF